ncbi:MAG TPA: hypothetical protein VHQ47_04410 [Phycisphaerae bacterium]|nr:hypothetical protein [Phycisphaerae bacterium]
MPELLTDLSRLVAATVNRLRLIQVDFADQPAETRETYLADEVEHALAKVLPEQRPQFLTELKARFPTWDRQVDITAPSANGAAHSALDAKELQDYTFLIARLIDLAPSLTEEQRKTAIVRLAEAGLADQSGGPDWPAAALKALKTRLQLTDRDQVDAAKLLELTGQLVAFIISLDQLVWATWKQVAPKSDMKRPTPVQRSMGRFVAGDNEVSPTQLAGDVDRLRQLCAGVISAIAQAGSLFAQRHVAKFSVANIEAYADKMPGMLVGKEVKCWRQYKELSTAMDVQTIEIEIQNAIAEYTETLIKGRSRT